jgi:hypothetical protein
LIIEKAKCTYGNLDYFWEVKDVPREDDFNFDTYYLATEILRTEFEVDFVFLFCTIKIGKILHIAKRFVIYFTSTLCFYLK